MEIKTQQDMAEFCEEVMKNKILNNNLFLKVFNKEDFTTQQVQEIEELNKEAINKGLIGKGSHLQQGIREIRVSNIESKIVIVETPYLYPSAKLLEQHPELTGAMTGNLSNCYDHSTKNFLFHMRGKDISAPFGFQAAAAGMGYFREHPGITARRELAEEAGILYAKSLLFGNPIDVLSFMKKAGEKAIPQPLFSFGFANDLSRFPTFNSLDEITEFEADIKKQLADKTIEQKEAYHFTLPYSSVEKIAGELNDKKRFYGPIYESTINFIRALKDSREI